MTADKANAFSIGMEDEASHSATQPAGHPRYLGTVIAQGLILSLGVVNGFVSARLLGPQGRGELAALTLWPIFLAYVASLGIHQSTIFQAGKQRYSRSEVWSASLVVACLQSVVLMGVCLVLIPHLLANYSPSVRRLGLEFGLAAPLVLLSGLPVSLLQGTGDLRLFNLLRLILPGTYAVVLVALLLLGNHNLVPVVEAQLAGYALTVALGIAAVYRCVNPGFHLRLEAVKQVLSYGIKAHLTNLTSYLNQRVDQLILALVIPARELGLYAVAVSLSLAITFLPLAVAINTFSYGARQSGAAARRTIAASFRLSLLWLLLACTALYVTAPFLIVTILGPRFSGSVLACRLLLPGTLALGLNQVLYAGANALGEPLLATWAEGIGLIATAVGLVLFVPHYGYLGAAAVSSVAYMVSFVAMLFLSAYRLDLGPRGLLFGVAGGRIGAVKTAEV